MIAGLVAGLDRLADVLSQTAAAIAAVIMAALCAHILMEIVLRRFGTSTFMLDEMGGYGIATMTFLAMAYTLRKGEMIRVHILLSRLGLRTRRYVEALCAGAALAGFGLITFYLGRSALRAFRDGTVGTGIVSVPQWIPEGVIFIGAFLLCFQLLVYGIQIVFSENYKIYVSSRSVE